MRLFRFLVGWWGTTASQPAPAERTFLVPAESRSLAVWSEARGFVVANEARQFVA